MKNIHILRVVYATKRISNRLIGFSRVQQWARLWFPLLMLGAIFITSPIPIFIFKGSLTILVYATILLTSNILLGGHRSFVMGMVFTVFVLMVNLVRPLGPFDEMHAPARAIKSDETIVSSIYLFPDSPKWDQIRKVEYGTYLFVSIRQELTDDEVLVRIGGRDYGPLQDMKKVIFGSGAYTVPIDPGLLEGKEYLDVELVFKVRRLLYLASSPLIPIQGRMPRQKVFKNGRWLPVPEEMGKSARLIVEIRMADKDKRTLGILY